MRETQVAAQALGVAVQVAEVRRPDEIERAFAAMQRASADALLLLTDSRLLEAHVRDITTLALQHRLPAIYPWRMYVEAGGLMSYGISLREWYRRAATYVDKILKGAKPADLPVEQPTTFELIINLKTAQALVLTIPPTLVFQADEVLR
jgi:putative tryptophan/tyrosine transport system substrate-binding protein